MGLTNIINNFISRMRPAQTKTTSDEGRAAASGTAVLLERFAVHNDRRSVVTDCRKMYANYPPATGAISTLARDAVKGGFTVNVTDAADIKLAQTAADDLIKRLSLFTRLDDWMRLTLRDGDSFLENSVDANRLIQQVTRKPTLEMNRNSNKIDRFDNPNRAYWLSDRDWGGATPGEDAVWFADWQIIHARWNHDEGSRYGRPQFASARKSYLRIDEGDSDIAIRRKTRAGMKYLHVLQGADDTAIEKYKEDNKDTLNKPFAAIMDFFTNEKASIQAISGDATLSDIADVLHHIDTWAVASPVPLPLIGFGKDLNRDILEQKLEQYERSLEPVTEWVTNEIVKPLLELQWLLLGLWPESMVYTITWASKKVITAENLKAVAEAGARLRALQWPDEMVVDILAPLIPGLNKQRLLDALKTQQASRPDEIDRLAALASQPSP
jgi:hypothetical protein